MDPPAGWLGRWALGWSDFDANADFLGFVGRKVKEIRRLAVELRHQLEGKPRSKAKLRFLDQAGRHFMADEIVDIVPVYIDLTAETQAPDGCFDFGLLQKG